jgi:hypothetical protein
MNSDIYCRIAELAYRTPASTDEDAVKKIFTDGGADISGLHHAYFFDSKKKGGDSDAQLYTLSTDDAVIFACRGTESLSDVATDMSIWKEPFQDLIYCNSVDTSVYKNIKVHAGFLDQYNTIKYSIMATLYNVVWAGKKNRTIVCVGHSLGGALASMAAACAKAHFGDKLRVECYTYGSPRVGNGDFVRYFDDNVDLCVRYVNGADIITRIPKVLFSHVKGEKKVGTPPAGCVERYLGSAEDHFMKNYKKALGL